MTQRQIGPFLIESQLGAGGMGIVYLATYGPTGKKVALKILTPSLSADEKLLRRFEREIDILKRMTHPNIVKYYGGGTEHQQRYYAMEYIDGGSLQDILKKKKRLNWEQTIQVGRQLCSALEHAHNAGIIHRDLKPANLFITSKGRLKLGDFGIARDTEATALTAAGKTVGTYAYMAPEQIHGNAPISRKTDLYAVGCLLFESLTGETPFVAGNPAEMLMQHLNDDPRDVREVVSDCPIWLDELIQRLLAKSQDDRPYDALAVHTELTSILRRLTSSQAVAASAAAAASTTAGGGATTVGGGSAKPKKKRRRGHSAFYERTWFLLLCLLLLIGGAIWFSLPPGENATYLAARHGWESGDAVTQREARDRYMLPYLQRFPNGAFRKDIQGWADQIQVDVLEAQAEKKAKGDKEPRDELEAAFITAWKSGQNTEKNPLEAIEQLHEMTVSIPRLPKEQTDSIPEAPHWVMLAQRHLDAARTRFLKLQNRDELIRQRMEQAEALMARRNTREATQIWFHFREVFFSVREVEGFYLYVRHRLNGEPADIPGASPQAQGKDTP